MYWFQTVWCNYGGVEYYLGSGNQTINLTKLFWGFVWPSKASWFLVKCAPNLPQLIGNQCENNLAKVIFWDSPSVLGNNFWVFAQLEEKLLLHHYGGSWGISLTSDTLEMTSCMCDQSVNNVIKGPTSRHFRGRFESSAMPCILCCRVSQPEAEARGCIGMLYTVRKLLQFAKQLAWSGEIQIKQIRITVTERSTEA